MNKWWKHFTWRYSNTSWKDFFKYITGRGIEDIVINEKPNYSNISSNCFGALATDAHSFLLLKPSGLEYELLVDMRLEQEGFKVREKRKIDNYLHFAVELYDLPVLKPEDDVPESYLWFKILEMKFPKHYNQAVAFVLDEKDSSKILPIKKKIRKEIGVKLYRVHYNGESFITCITPFHSAKDYLRDYPILLKHSEKTKS